VKINSIIIIIGAAKKSSPKKIENKSSGGEGPSCGTTSKQSIVYIVYK